MSGPTPRRRPLHRTLLAGILAVYVLLATTYSLIVPLGEGPDEAPHFTVVRYIVQHGGRLPASEEEHEAFQPPLYYLLGAGLTAWCDYDGYTIKANADFSLEPGAPKSLLLHPRSESFPFRGPALAWHLLRLLSVVCGAVTVWATYRLGRTIFPDRPALALGMAAVNACVPEFLFMSGLVNNDNLATALAALLLWQMARLVMGEDRPANVAAIGLLLGLGVLAKVSVAVTALPAGLALAYAAWRREGRWKPAVGRLLRWGLLVSGLALLVCGWWFLRNYWQHGDPTGWSFILRTNALREGGLTPAVIGWLLAGLFRSFWLAWIGISLSGWLYGLLGALSLAALAGLIRLAGWRRSTLSGRQWAALGVCGVQIAVVLGSLLKWTATVLGTDQARLIYPALPALLLFLVLGLAEWAGRRGEGRLALGLAVGFLALGLAAPWWIIAPVHAGPQIVTEAQVAAEATPAGIPFGGALRLAGYRLSATPAAPGDLVELELFWQGLRPIEEDLWLHMSLVAAEDAERVLVTKDGSPSAGRDTTDRWSAGQIIRSAHRLRLPADAPAGRYLLRLGIHPFGTWDWLPAGADGTAQIVLGELSVR